MRSSRIAQASARIACLSDPRPRALCARSEIEEHHRRRRGEPGAALAMLRPVEERGDRRLGRTSADRRLQCRGVERQFHELAQCLAPRHRCQLHGSRCRSSPGRAAWLATSGRHSFPASSEVRLPRGHFGYSIGVGTTTTWGRRVRWFRAPDRELVRSATSGSCRAGGEDSLALRPLPSLHQEHPS